VLEALDVLSPVFAFENVRWGYSGSQPWIE
jgi:hypothetical protein